LMLGGIVICKFFQFIFFISLSSSSYMDFFPHRFNKFLCWVFNSLNFKILSLNHILPIHSFFSDFTFLINGVNMAVLKHSPTRCFQSFIIEDLRNLTRPNRGQIFLFILTNSDEKILLIITII